MKINGVDFNENWVKSLSEAYFVRYFSKIIWQNLPDGERSEKLKAAYYLITDRPPAVKSKKLSPSQEVEKSNEGA